MLRANGRLESEWQQTSLIVWMIRAVHAKAQGKPADWNLYEQAKQKANPTKLDAKLALRMARAAVKAREERV